MEIMRGLRSKAMSAEKSPEWSTIVMREGTGSTASPAAKLSMLHPLRQSKPDTRLKASAWFWTRAERI